MTPEIRPAQPPTTPAALAALAAQMLDALKTDPARLVEIFLSRAADRLIDGKELAQLLAVSDASLDRLLAARKVLTPVRLAGCRRWVLSHVLAWLADGCPDPASWESRRRARR